MAARVPIGGIEGGFDDGDGVNNTPVAAADDFGSRAYNNFWVDPGSNLALVKGEYRTSYIVNPENGQVPRLENPTTDYRRTNFGSRYLTGIGNADGPEALPLSERCILSEGKAGPAMQSGLYNNTYQFVQTTDYVMIDVDKCTMRESFLSLPRPSRPAPIADRKSCNNTWETLLAGMKVMLW
jgi:hypothetical protein